MPPQRRGWHEVYRVLSLFSGIAGFEQGIAAAGLQEQFQVVQFVENNEYCQKVLAKHYPTIPVWGDVRSFNPKPREFDGICAGFPCQPFSTAGKRKGKEDDRYLWDEVVRLLRAVQPRWFLGENVAGLLSIDSGRVFGKILWDLVQCGYSVEWGIVSAAQVGGVHRRERVFIIATNAQSTRWGTSWDSKPQTGANAALVGGGDARRGETQAQPCFRRENARIPEKLDTNLMTHQDLPEWLPLATDNENIPYRKERLMALGNAVVPQVAAIAWKRLAQIAGVEE